MKRFVLKTSLVLVAMCFKLGNGVCACNLQYRYLDIILCFIAIVLVFEIERMVPLKLGKVDTKMHIRTTLDSLSHRT